MDGCTEARTCTRQSVVSVAACRAANCPASISVGQMGGGYYEGMRHRRQDCKLWWPSNHARLLTQYCLDRMLDSLCRCVCCMSEPCKILGYRRGLVVCCFDGLIHITLVCHTSPQGPSLSHPAFYACTSTSYSNTRHLRCPGYLIPRGTCRHAWRLVC